MMDYTWIPQELKELNQWVCTWDNSKIPMKAFEKKAASSTAPDTWSSFDQAQGAVESGYYDHVGFVHILLRGNLPFPGKNNLNGVEIYQARRFFIMTGKVLIFPEIIENQAAIDYVVEKYFPETERDGKKSPLVQRIYSPQYRKPLEGTIFVRPEYPPIPSGGRNLSLTSLAGAMHNTGYTRAQIYTELCYVNQTQCKPPLPDRELETICESVTRYRR